MHTLQKTLGIKSNGYAVRMTLSCGAMRETCRRASVIGKVLAFLTGLCVATSFSSAQAAQNCISNGDFEQPVANYNHGTGYSYNSENGNGGKPTGWTLSPTNRMGRVLEGTDRFGVLDLMGKYSLFFERRKNETSVLEAKQSFAIPAPGRSEEHTSELQSRI